MKLSTFLTRFSERAWPAKKHRRDSIQRINRFIDFNGDSDIDDLTAEQVYDFMDHLKNAGMSVATVNRYVAAIKSVLSFACKSKISTNNFMVVIEKEKSRIRFFSDNELDQIKQWCKVSRAPDWFGHMCAVSRYTGMRHGEVLKLRNASQSRLYEGDKGIWWIELFETKNGDPRNIPLYQPEAVEAARALAAGFEYNSNTFYRSWDRMRKAIAGNDKQFVFHVFRHTAASTMANEFKLNSDVIGQWLGHRNPKTTSKYIHIKPATMEDIAMRLAGAA